MFFIGLQVHRFNVVLYYLINSCIHLIDYSKDTIAKQTNVRSSSSTSILSTCKKDRAFTDKRLNHIHRRTVTQFSPSKNKSIGESRHVRSRACCRRIRPFRALVGVKRFLRKGNWYGAQHHIVNLPLVHRKFLARLLAKLHCVVSYDRSLKVGYEAPRLK